MRKLLLAAPLCGLVLGGAFVCVADDDNETSATTTPAAPSPTPSAAHDAGIKQVTSESASASTAPGAPEAPKYSADAKWEIAGYNNEEIIYTILVTNEDTRIIHCNAQLKGFYFENGEKHSISDRQGSTIFPGRQVAVGHWMGMDQSSGATYEVKCRAI